MGKSTVETAHDMVSHFHHVMEPERPVIPRRKTPIITGELVARADAALSAAIARAQAHGFDDQIKTFEELKTMMKEVVSMAPGKETNWCGWLPHKWSRWVHSGTFSNSARVSYETVEISYAKMLSECIRCGMIRTKDVEILRSK